MASKGNNEREKQAQADLDAVLHQSGGALSGEELRARAGDGQEAWPTPPLDTRLTFRNIVLQLAAIVLFIGVMWFMIDVFFSGLIAAARYVGQGG